MKIGLAAWLASPCCSAALKFASLKDFPASETAEVRTGTLECAACGRQYPIVDGVPRLRPLEDAASDVVKTRESFSWEWSRYPGSLPEDERIFLEETQLAPGAFEGKLVLDAGCGMGRYSMVALKLGAEVVALDLSESLLRLAEIAPSHPKLHVVQGDLLRPPLKAGAFDIVYSQGVLHHTADTKASFQRVAVLVKRGGALSVWLYGKAGRFAEFSTNPIRADRPWVASHRRLAWLVVAVRHAVSDLLRVFTTRLPLGVTYALCYPLALLGALPGLKYLTFSVHPRFTVRVLENFDWLSPPYQYHHTKEELAAWYREAGFDVLKVLPHGLVPKPGILGRKNGHA